MDDPYQTLLRVSLKCYISVSRTNAKRKKVDVKVFIHTVKQSKLVIYISIS